MNGTEYDEDPYSFYADNFFTTEYKALAITPKVTASLSVLGSGYIIWHVLWHKPRKLREQISTRIVLALSVTDIVYSFIGHFLGSWLVPEGQAVYSIGTVATCNAQGFIRSFAGEYSVALNTILALVYLLTVRYGWREDAFKKWQWAFFLPPLGLCLSLAILRFRDGVYNYDGSWNCYIADAPLGCHRYDDIECQRGANSDLWLAQSLVYLAICNTVIVASMILLYRAVLEQERVGDKYFRSAGNELNRKQSRQVARQGLFYVGAFYATYLVFYAYVFTALVTKPPFIIRILDSFLLPLQGLFNSFVYVRPRLMRYMSRHHPEKLEIMQNCFSVVCCCACGCVCRTSSANDDRQSRFWPFYSTPPRQTSSTTPTSATSSTHPATVAEPTGERAGENESGDDYEGTDDSPQWDSVVLEIAERTEGDLEVDLEANSDTMTEDDRVFDC